MNRTRKVSTIIRGIPTSIWNFIDPFPRKRQFFNKVDTKGRAEPEENPANPGMVCMHFVAIPLRTTYSCQTMKLPRLRTILLAPVVLFIAFYFIGVMANLLDDRKVEPLSNARSGSIEEIAVFGASGTAGDGILKAALADPGVNTIHVITRRTTPRIEAGVARGKVVMTKHTNYLDYSAVQDRFRDVRTVYWALGTSSRNVDDETYSVIHVDFPLQFVKEWLQVSRKPDISFHYISSSDISEDSSMHWAREKVRAEKELFALADRTKLKVIAYRPDYIGPTEEEAHLGQELLYWFFAPVRAAVRAQQIGESMLEVTVRGDEFENGDKLGTVSILNYSDAYRNRQ